MSKTRIVINYNPYTLDNTSIEFEAGNRLENILLPSHCKTSLQDWLFSYEIGREKWDGLLTVIAQQIGKKRFTVVFKGRMVDYNDISLAISDLGDEYDIDIDYEEAGETEEKIKELGDLYKCILSSPLTEVRDQFDEALKIVLNKNFTVGIFGKMSCGKTTLINALVGNKILETATKECTTKNYKIYDIDERDEFLLSYFDDTKGEEVLFNESDLTEEKLKELNQRNDIRDIKIEGNIQFVDNDICRLVIVDTPGSNTDNKENSDAAYESLENAENAVRILVFDASEIESEDTKKVLMEVAKEITTSRNSTSENILFVINKMDELINNDEDILEKIDSVKKRLKEVGIKNPKIFPMNSFGALVTKEKIAGRQLKIGEKNAYNTLLMLMDDPDGDKYNLFNYAPISRELKEELLEKNSSVDERALLYSGIYALEHEIIQYINKYSFPIKIRNFYKTYMDIFYEQIKYDRWIVDKIEEVKEDKNKSLELEKEIADKKTLQAAAKQMDQVKIELDHIKRENRKHIEDLSHYVSENEKALVQEIEECISEYEDLKGVGIGIHIFLAVIGIVIPGGWITTIIGQSLGGLVSFLNVAIDEDTKKGIETKIKGGMLENLKNKFSEVEDYLEKSFSSLAARTKNIMSRIGVTDIEEISDMEISSKEIEVDPKILRKLMKNKEKKKEELENYINNYIISSLLTLKENYYKGSEKIIQVFEINFEKAREILRRVTNDLQKIRESKENVDVQIKKVNEEIEWMKEIKGRLERIVNI